MNLKLTEGRKIFEIFLKTEYSDSNLLFWSACEEYKTETEATSLLLKSRRIYNEFVSLLSPKEVKVSSNFF